ncbi:hypothetical protein HY065_02475, partial [Candidatus Berkelbacteria bacterium]|nr:hypothetical protein [Candidatus Berkelbacteria bacterium]
MWKIVGLIIAGFFVIVVIAIFVGIAGTGSGPGGRTTDQSTNQFAATTLGNAGGDLANGLALTLEQIRSILTRNNSPLAAFANRMAQAAQQFHINPALSLAIMKQDSSFGTKGPGQCGRNNNPGNIEFREDLYRPAGIEALPGKGDTGRFAHFKDCGDGIWAKIWLLRAHYLDQGELTVEKI